MKSPVDSLGRIAGPKRSAPRLGPVFIHRPSDRVKQAADTHLGTPVTLAIPVTWGGLGLSTFGLFALVGGGGMVGAVTSSFGLSWPLAAGFAVLSAWLLVQAVNGSFGHGSLALTTSEHGRRRGLVLRAGRFATVTGQGEIYRVYREPVTVEFVQTQRWWQAPTLVLGPDVYFINPNYELEVTRALAGATKRPFDGDSGTNLP